MKKVSVVGDTSIDHFLMLDGQDACLMGSSKEHKKELCLKYGEKITIDSEEKYFGGSALNVAVGLARFGNEVVLSSIVGSDLEGREILGYLNSQQVITDHIEVKGQTNQSFIIIFKSERTILSHHKPRDYSRVYIPKSDIIYFASAGVGSEVFIDKIRKNVHAGAKLIFNPGSYEISSFDFFKPLLAITTVFIINRSEANQIIEDTSKIESQLEKVLRFGTKVAVITDGKNGAYFATAEGNFHMPAAPSNVVDPTGAGDAFSSGLVAGLMEGKSLEESAKWGINNSASAVESYGANSSLLDQSSIIKHLENKILKFSRT